MSRTRTINLFPALTSLGAIAAALVIGAAFLTILGLNAGGVYRTLLAQGLGTSAGLSGTLVLMAPILAMAAGLLIAFTAGIWNIGADGQFLMGALVVGILGPSLVSSLPLYPALGILLLAGALGGAVWALVPTLLKTRYGLNEIITTIMMNYTALYLSSWLVKGPFKDPSVVPPQTVLIPVGKRLPGIPGFEKVHVGLLVGIGAVIIAYWVIRYTALGFGMRVCGQNIKAAHHAGIPVARVTGTAFLLSAALAGLAGSIDVLGVKGLFQGEWNPGYGFTAVALVFLARLNGLGMLPLAFFFSFLSTGGEMMARTTGVPVYFVRVLEGLMLLLFGIGEYVERRRRLHDRA